MSKPILSPVDGTVNRAVQSNPETHESNCTIPTSKNTHLVDAFLASLGDEYKCLLGQWYERSESGQFEPITEDEITFAVRLWGCYTGLVDGGEWPALMPRFLPLLATSSSLAVLQNPKALKSLKNREVA